MPQNKTINRSSLAQSLTPMAGLVPEIKNDIFWWRDNLDEACKIKNITQTLKLYALYYVDEKEWEELTAFAHKAIRRLPGEIKLNLPVETMKTTFQKKFLIEDANTMRALAKWALASSAIGMIQNQHGDFKVKLGENREHAK